MNVFGCATGEIEHAIRSAGTTPVLGPDGVEYAFQRFAFGERGEFLTGRLLGEVVGGLTTTARDAFPAPDVVVCPEPGGHTWGMTVAHQLGCALAIIRENTVPEESGPDGFAVRSAYRAASFRIPPIEPGARVLVVDDVISSGGTLAGVLHQLAGLPCELLGAAVILAKGEQGLRRVRAVGYPVLALVTIASERILPPAADSARA